MTEAIFPRMGLRDLAIGIHAQLNARLRTGIVREEVLREMNAAKGRR